MYTYKNHTNRVFNNAVVGLNDFKNISKLNKITVDYLVFFLKKNNSQLFLYLINSLKFKKKFILPQLFFFFSKQVLLNKKQLKFFKINDFFKNKNTFSSNLTLKSPKFFKNNNFYSKKLINTFTSATIYNNKEFKTKQNFYYQKSKPNLIYLKLIKVLFRALNPLNYEAFNKFYINVLHFFKKESLVIKSKETNFNKFFFKKLIKRYKLEVCNFKRLKICLKKIFNDKTIIFSELNKKIIFTNTKVSYKKIKTYDLLKTTINAEKLPYKFIFFDFKNILNIFFSLSLLKFYSFFFFDTLIFVKFKKYLNSFYFYSCDHKMFMSNIATYCSLNYKLKKGIMRLQTNEIFNMLLLSWFDKSLIKFIENCTKARVALNFYTYMNNILDASDIFLCTLWFIRLKYFQKTLGHGFFLLEAIYMIYISLKLKDPFLLINWVSHVLQKISFWKHRNFFHFLRYGFKFCFVSVFKQFGIKGLRFKLKGKISVAGNARTRTVTYQIGHISFATYDNKVLYSYNLLKTFTGALGLQIWFVF